MLLSSRHHLTLAMRDHSTGKRCLEVGELMYLSIHTCTLVCMSAPSTAMSNCAEGIKVKLFLLSYVITRCGLWNCLNVYR